MHATVSLLSSHQAGHVCMAVCEFQGGSMAILLDHIAVHAGGENVYCSEVEAVLSAHPQVLQAAVFGMPNSVMGVMVHAAIVLRHPPSTTPVTPQHLIAWCHSQLALYKCPTAVHMVKELPTTGSGKVLKNVLRATFTRGSSPAAAATAVASPAAAAVTAAAVPASAGPVLAVAAAAAAEAAVNAVASYTDHSASDAHTPFRGISSSENGRDGFDMLDAIQAQCPGARVLDIDSDGLVEEPEACYIVVLGDWDTALAQVLLCPMYIGEAAHSHVVIPAGP